MLINPFTKKFGFIVFFWFFIVSCSEIKENSTDFNVAQPTSSSIYQTIGDNVFIRSGLEYSTNSFFPMTPVQKLFLQYEFTQISQIDKTQLQDPKDYFLYLYTLYNQKKYSTMIQSKNLINKIKPLSLKAFGSYFLCLGYLHSSRITKGKECVQQYYSQWEKFLLKANDDSSQNFIDRPTALYEAFTHHQENSSMKDYLYYRYVFEKKRNYKHSLIFLKQSILLGSELALEEVNFKNYKKLFKPEEYQALAKLIETTNPTLALNLDQKIHDQKAVARLAYKLHQYSLVLTNADEKSRLYLFSKMAMNGNSVLYHQLINLDLSSQEAQILFQYAKRKKKYQDIFRILKKQYMLNYLRIWILYLYEHHRQKELFKGLEYFYHHSFSFDLEGMTMLQFWYGKLLKEASDDRWKKVFSELVKRFPRTFYGLMALQELGDLKLEYENEWREFWQSEDLWLKENNWQGYQDIINNPQVELGAILTGLGLQGFGSRFLKQVFGAEYSISNYYQLFREYLKIGRVDLASSFLRRFLYQLFKDRHIYLVYKDLIPVLYPIIYRDAVNEATGLFQVPVSRIYSIMLLESSFYPYAISYVGARGLMQLMTPTAKPILKTLKVKKIISSDSIRQLFNPRDNILTGSFHLQSINRSYQFIQNQQIKSILTFASYNAGVKRIKRSFLKYSERSPNQEFWIEQIPFYESRNYAKRGYLTQQIYQYYYKMD